MLHTIPTLPQLDGLADALMKETLSGWRIGQAVERKPDGSLVTPVDKRANAIAMEWARGYDIGFIGEEGSDPTITKDYVLYVDPLDGTSTYIAGKPEFTVVITLMKRTGAHWKAECCIIAEPVSGRKYYSDGSSGVLVSTPDDPTPRRMRSLQSHDSPFHVSVITWRDVPFRLGAVRNTVETHRHLHHHGCGSTGINGPLIASGGMHGVVYGGPFATEATAVSLMVRAAGGVATDIDGKILSLFELKDFDGRLDFALPRGMIAASSMGLSELLRDLVKHHQ